MKQRNKSHILFRYSGIIAGILIFATIIVVKMVRTTIIDADKWNDKAQSFLSQVDEIPPERGNIYAANGSILATNLHYYTARIDWATEGISPVTFKQNLPALCDSLHAFYPKKSAKEWNKELSVEIDRPVKKRAYRLFGRLTYSEYNRLKSFPYLNLPKKNSGFYTETSTQRIKPYGSMASRSIGNVGELKGGGRHGVSGIEKALDSLLYGVPGEATKVQMTNNISNWASVPPKRGYDITTTIDVDIQDIIEEELYNMCVDSKSRWGTAVIMEVKTGEIKAISNLEWNNNFNDYVEGRNNAVLGYEPGSVMKTISMMVALEEGIVNDIDQVIYTAGFKGKIGGKPISDSHPYASMPIRKVIAASSNIGMANIIFPHFGSQPGLFYHRLKQMGFFEPLRTGIAGETTPKIDSLKPNSEGRLDLTRMSYGYRTLIPPMSVLAIYNAIANNGKYIRPHLVKSLKMEDGRDSVIPTSYIREQVCSPKNASKLRQMLNDVVWMEGGTGRVLKDDRVNISGKTSTAFTVINGQYSAQKRYTFCGFFPYENPKYTCIVVMLGADRGAARCSGIVLKNTALKLYSRGMLGNVSDYKAEKKEPTRGIMFASTNKAITEQQKAEMQLRGINVFKAPKDVANGVPSVIGLSIRDAIEILEKRGLNVSFQGTGYVARQSIPSGSKIRKGERIALTLK